MKKTIKPAVLVALAVVAILVLSSAYVVRQTETAMVFQFGKLIRVDKEPGLKFKVPMIQNLVFYDKRLIQLDPEPEEVILSDQKRLKVDSFTRFRIVNPLLFYQTVLTERKAIERLEDIINSSLRQVLGKVTLPSLLSEERKNIMKEISDKVRAGAIELGVEVADVRIRRADLPKEVSEAINERMKTERERDAKEFRAQGQELAQEIRAKSERERTVILAEADKKAQTTKGEGDNVAAKVWASAANKDPEFFAFYRSLDAYKKAIEDNGTSMVLSPDSEFFKYFNKVPASR